MSTVPAKSTFHFIFVCIILSWKMFIHVHLLSYHQHLFMNRKLFWPDCFLFGLLISFFRTPRFKITDSPCIDIEHWYCITTLYYITYIISIMITFQLWHIDTCKQHHGMKLIVPKFPKWLLENFLHLLPLSSSSKWIFNVCPIFMYFYVSKNDVEF